VGLDNESLALRTENAFLRAQLAARPAPAKNQSPAAAVEERLWPADGPAFRILGWLPEPLSRAVKGVCQEGAVVRLIRGSGLFDAGYYRSQQPAGLGRTADPVGHFVRSGALQGHDPHPLFSTSFYLERNPDVAQSRVNPLVHFLLAGAQEGRDPHPLFHSSFYLSQNPDVAQAGHNPLVHYLRYGASEGRDPNPGFRTAAYVRCHPDLVGKHLNPLIHFTRRDVAARVGLGDGPGLRMPAAIAT
jgi:hypothetical protein